jgi:hypothetical protein
MATFRGRNIVRIERNQRDKTYVLIGEDESVEAELKDHEFLSQPQLRMLEHGNGGHRRANTKVHSGAAGKPYLTWPQGALLFAPSTWGTFAFPSSEPAKPIENAGIRAGEIIAPRGWLVGNGTLHSIYRRHVWQPGAPMTGDVRGAYGVHAFKTADSLTEYIIGYRLHHAMMESHEAMMARVFEMEHKPQPQPTFAIGSVALWGDVIEHERGYRAEFAKIVSIDKLDGGPTEVLPCLRARYCPLSSAKSIT